MRSADRAGDRLQAGRARPLAVAAGLSPTFVALGLIVSIAGRSLVFTDATLANAGAVLMMLFGLVLLVSRFSARFATASAGVSAKANAKIDATDQSGLTVQFVCGLLLGIVWSPCIGPTLGDAISLASQGENLLHATGIMVAFALGVSTIILVLRYGAQSVIRKRRARMRSLANSARPTLGAVFVAVGAAIHFKFHHTLEFWALEYLPEWFTELSVSI